MAMEMIPAIDLKDGRCVRLLQGRFDQETVFSDDPVSIARKWVQAGAPRLHVVDLDGAKQGKPQHLPVIAEIVKAVAVPVQLGGGIREAEIVRSVIGLGIERVVIGTVAALNAEKAGRLFAEFGERVAAGIDAREGRVAIRGWQETTDQSAIELGRKLENLGAKRIIFTDITRDGMLSGPNFASIEEMVRAVGIPIIASGGVSRLEDIQRLKEIGVEGAIVGKALYTGDLDLKAACRLAEEL